MLLQLQRNRGRPLPPGPRFGLRTMRQFGRDPMRLVLDLTDAYGDVVGLGFAGYILISHPDHVQHVLQDNSKNYWRGRRAHRRSGGLFGKGVVFNDGEPWRRQRLMLTPALSPKVLRHYLPHIVRETLGLAGRWETNAAEVTLDVKAEMRELAQNIVLGVLFQTTLRDSKRIARAMDGLGRYIDRSMRTPIYLPPSIPTPANLRFRRAVRELDETLLPMIAQHRSEDTRPENVLSILLRARDEETGAPLTDRQLRDEIVDVFFAGHDTASNTLAWTLCFLSRHDDVRKRLEEEVDRVLGGRPPSYDDLQGLVYTEHVIDEVLRLRPPAWVLAREAYQEDEIGGFRIPAKSMVFASPYVTHRRTDQWEDPESFDPDRFAPERSYGRHRFAWYPFGGGPRLCLGKLFAYAELKTVLALIAQRYRLDLVAETFPPPELGLTVGPRGPIAMRVQRRAWQPDPGLAPPCPPKGPGPLPGRNSSSPGAQS